MTDDKAAEAREGLFDSVAGKAKEVAGAVTGRDDLVEEGQLQQAEASSRKAAVADEAIAEATRQEATKDILESSREAALEKGAAQAEADRAAALVEQRRETDHEVAAREAEALEARESEKAEQEADELAATRQDQARDLAANATATEREAATERLRLEREAAVADQQAAQLRAETEK